MTQSITAAVGEGGANKRLDVAIIQLLLADPQIPVEAGMSPLLVPDGIFGTQTANAIRLFQRAQFGIDDGLVQPSDFTMKRLNELTNRFMDPAVPGSPCGLKHAALQITVLDLGDLQGPGEILSDGVGVVQRWSLGTVYHHPAIGAFEVHGAILEEYKSVGEAQSVLGYPISDEREAGSPSDRVSHFQFGSIFFSPAGGVATLLSPGI